MYHLSKIMNHILHTAGLIFRIASGFFLPVVERLVILTFCSQCCSKPLYKLQLFEQKPCLIVFSQICQVVHIASMNQC